MTGSSFGHRWRTTARRLELLAASLGLLVVGFAAGNASAQDPTGSTPDVIEDDPPILQIPAEDLKNAWLEATALDHDELPPLVFLLEDRRSEDGTLQLRADALSNHMVMLCTRAETLGVNCEVIFLLDDETIETTWAPGWQISGRYFLDDLPAPGVQVALVPMGLESLRPYTMPLGPGTNALGELKREVETDADGIFTTPAIAEGVYFLEAVLPSGRVHRTEPFILPSPDLARSAEDEASEEPLIWQLGDIEVDELLSVQVRVFDELGQPIVGAVVGATQGEEPRQVISFQARTNSDGIASLSGFSAEQPARLTCQARGHRHVELRFELIPALVECELETLARVSGEVVTVDDEAPVGGVVSITPEDDDEGSTLTLPMNEDDGRFAFELEAGSYRLALAAPGYAVEQRDLVLEPGEHRELGTLVLLAGRELLAKVVDARGGQPLEEVMVEAVDPPGAAFGITDQDGEVRLTTAPDEPLVLRFSHHEYAPRSVAVDPTSDDEPLLVELERGGFIGVKIYVDGTDLPCQGCRAVIEPGGEELLTNEWGFASSSPLAEGYYRVHRARAEHLGSLVIEQTDAEVRHVKIEPPQGAWVTFGRRGDTVSVRIVPSPGSGWTLSARSGVHFARYYAQGDGTFEVQRRDRPELLELFLHHFDPSRGTELEVWQGTVPLDAEEMTLELPRTLVEGRAVTAAGPVAAQVVELRTFDFGRLAAKTRTDGDGAFYIPHVPPGVYALRIGDRTVQLLSLRRSERLNLRTFELLSGGF